MMMTMMTAWLLIQALQHMTSSANIMERCSLFLPPRWTRGRWR
jgi:hypothetical protein